MSLGHGLDAQSVPKSFDRIGLALGNCLAFWQDSKMEHSHASVSDKWEQESLAPSRGNCVLVMISMRSSII